MKLYRIKATADGEPTMVFIAAASAIEAVHALTDYDLGDTDWESVKPFLSGDKRPTLVSALEKVPDEYHDTIYIGENDNEQTVQEFFD